jgi:hypothetical protein
MISTGSASRWNFGTAMFTTKTFVNLLKFTKRWFGHTSYNPSISAASQAQLSGGFADHLCRKVVGRVLIVEGLVLSKRNLGLFIAVMMLVGCSKNSNSSEGESSSAVLTGITIKGFIKSATGSQSEMNQWVLALVERDSGIAHSGVVNAVGNYTIKGVSTAVPYTMVLMDPQYRFSAILTYVGLNSGQVRQYFKIGEDLLPPLVHRGPIINFTDSSSVAWEKNEASDKNDNLIPDAVEVTLVSDSTIDTDGDGLTNDEDGDIDGDGLPNWFDSDDDGDNIADAFDNDANGDGLADLTQRVGDQYFPRLLKYIAVQIVQDVGDDGSLSSTLMLTTQLQENEKATSIKVKGSSVLFTEASAVRYDPTTGDTSTSSWDQTLLDDGNNEDGDVDDRIFARRVQLKNGMVPKAKQVFFVEVTQGTGEEVLISEFPFTFPGMVTGVISADYTSATRKVTLQGTPFGGITEYKWSIHISDAAGIKVFASEPIAGTVATYTLPTGAVDTGQSYTARIVATAIDRVPSFPSWVIRSASFSLN